MHLIKYNEENINKMHLLSIDEFKKLNKTIRVNNISNTNDFKNINNLLQKQYTEIDVLNNSIKNVGELTVCL
jgi:hypothetical protein